MSETVALRRRVKDLLTPEGVKIPFAVASIGDRLGAFLLDFLLVIVALVVVWIIAGLAFTAERTIGVGAGVFSLALIANFFLRNGYFIFCEIHLGGRTLGKWAVGLRVISRDGGPLSAEAVIARNLTRDLEFYMPLSAAVLALVVDAPWWISLGTSLWLFIFCAVPLFNKDRLRVGDIIGGTIVVRTPRSVLLPDLADRVVQVAGAAPTAVDPRFPFTQEQLDIYGIHELQVLEDLLRRYEHHTLDFRVLQEVCEKIKNKISWPRDQWQVPVHDFLQAFYKAQRHRLERKMLFGNRQERKKY